jgi:hypothetical protein
MNKIPNNLTDIGDDNNYIGLDKFCSPMDSTYKRNVFSNNSTSDILAKKRKCINVTPRGVKNPLNCNVTPLR